VFTLTNEFIDACKTPSGSWNRRQFDVIGVDWPPRHGWKSTVIGNQITDDQKAEFKALSITGNIKIKKKKNKITDSVQTIVTKRYEIQPGLTIAWTDGACDPNPDGDGGYGVVFERDGKTIAELSGGEGNTTNNRMEMLAVIEAIRATSGDVLIRTDSQLVLLCATGRWKRKANLDLWTIYDGVSAGRNVLFEWWRGHIGTKGNERADELAEKGRLEFMQSTDVSAS
jgi:ribonuclease HI